MSFFLTRHTYCTGAAGGGGRAVSGQTSSERQLSSGYEQAWQRKHADCCQAREPAAQRKFDVLQLPRCARRAKLRARSSPASGLPAGLHSQAYCAQACRQPSRQQKPRSGARRTPPARPLPPARTWWISAVLRDTSSMSLPVRISSSLTAALQGRWWWCRGGERVAHPSLLWQPRCKAAKDSHARTVAQHSAHAPPARPQSSPPTCARRPRRAACPPRAQSSRPKSCGSPPWCPCLRAGRQADEKEVRCQGVVAKACQASTCMHPRRPRLLHTRADCCRRALTLDVDVDGEMRVHQAHLVLVALGHAGDHVLKQAGRQAGGKQQAGGQGGAGRAPGRATGTAAEPTCCRNDAACCQLRCLQLWLLAFPQQALPACMQEHAPTVENQSCS